MTAYLKLKLNFEAYEYFACKDICVPRTNPLFPEVRREHQILWDWSDACLCLPCRLSARMPSVPVPWVICAAWSCCFVQPSSRPFLSPSLLVPSQITYMAFRSSVALSGLLLSTYAGDLLLNPRERLVLLHSCVFMLGCKWKAALCMKLLDQGFIARPQADVASHSQEAVWVTCHSVP